MFINRNTFDKPLPSRSTKITKSVLQFHLELKRFVNFKFDRRSFGKPACPTSNHSSANYLSCACCAAGNRRRRLGFPCYSCFRPLHPKGLVTQRRLSARSGYVSNKLCWLSWIT